MPFCIEGTNTNPFRVCISKWSDDGIKHEFLYRGLLLGIVTNYYIRRSVDLPKNYIRELLLISHFPVAGSNSLSSVAMTICSSAPGPPLLPLRFSFSRISSASAGLQHVGTSGTGTYLFCCRGTAMLLRLFRGYLSALLWHSELTGQTARNLKVYKYLRN